MTLCKQVNRSDSFNEVILKQVVIDDEDNVVCDYNLDDYMILTMIMISMWLGTLDGENWKGNIILWLQRWSLFERSVPVIMRELDKLDLFQVPIVNTSDEELEEVEEILSGLVVNPNGHYERFDEIDLEEEEENKEGEEDGESELSLVLNELPECERNHIVDVMCRELEMEIANQQKIR